MFLACESPRKYFGPFGEIFSTHEIGPAGFFGLLQKGAYLSNQLAGPFVGTGALCPQNEKAGLVEVLLDALIPFLYFAGAEDRL